MVKSITIIVKNYSSSELDPCYRNIVSFILIYDGLVDYAALADYRVKHSKNEFANNHINGIENFWGYA